MSVDGKWDIVTKSPMGEQKGVLTLVADGNALTGTMAGPQGDVELQDGKIDGDELSWVADIPTPPIKLEVTAKVEGDSISGSMKLGMFGTASFSGTRA